MSLDEPDTGEPGESTDAEESADDSAQETVIESSRRGISLEEIRERAAKRREEIGPGGDMSMKELMEAEKDPDHPRHADAVETSRRLAKELRPALKGLVASLRPAGGFALGEGLKGVGATTFEHVSPLPLQVPDPPELPTIDFSNTPQARTAAFSEQTVETLEAIAGTLLEQNRAATAANAEASKIAKRTFWVAVFTLMATVLGIIATVLLTLRPWG